MSVPESISEILSAISDSGTTRTTLLYLERITFRGLPSLASLPLTLPLFHSTSPTESFAYCALYPLVSSLSGTSTSTVTRLGRIHADLNWSLRGEREVCQYGLYAAFTSVAFFPVASFPPLSSLNTYLGVPSLYVPSWMMSSGCSSAWYQVPGFVGSTSEPPTFAAIGGYSFPSMTWIARYTLTVGSEFSLSRMALSSTSLASE